MNRKLHNSLTAAMACSMLLVAALLVSAPADSATSPAIAAVAAGQVVSPADAPRSERPVVRRPYQSSVRMPFFSFFSPRG